MVRGYLESNITEGRLLAGCSQMLARLSEWLLPLGGSQLGLGLKLTYSPQGRDGC